MQTLESEIEVTQQPEAPRPAPGEALQYGRAFAGLFLRDLHVLRREILPFLIRVCMNPLLFLFVFTYIMPHMSGGAAMNPTAAMAGVNFSTVLLPGLMAVAIMFSGIAAVALPLAQEFGITREIDDRVMCPLPVAAVAIEKICFSALQSMIAAAVVFPLAYYVPATPVYAHVSSWPFLIAGAGAGQPDLRRAGPGDRHQREAAADRADLRRGGDADHVSRLRLLSVGRRWSTIRWLQIGVLINPIVYMSEGLRAALTPALPHMHLALILAMLTFFLVLLTSFGIRGFLRRVIG